MTAEDALRFLAHEALECRQISARMTHREARDVLEMHALLYPSVLRALSLAPMEDHEARVFNYELQQEFRRLREPMLTGATLEP